MTLCVLLPLRNQSIRQRQRKKHEAATGGDTLFDKSISPNGATETPPKAGTTEKRPKPLIDEEKVQKGQVRMLVLFRYFDTEKSF